MAKRTRKLRDFFRPGERRRTSPTSVIGSPGYVIYAGWIDEGELDRKVATVEARGATYADLVKNTSIVAASVRYFLSLIAKAEWSFEPAETADGEEYAERLEEMLMRDPRTPWHKIVRRAAMYRFHGFSVQEFVARRRPDGWLTIGDLLSRPQHTCERWDIDPVTSYVLGILQRRAQDQQYVYLPRSKLLYLNDDSLSDSPMGLGIFRHLVGPNERLRRYEQLEAFGFEVDLRNVPVVSAPLSELEAALGDNEIQKEQFDAILKPYLDFAKMHVRTPHLGMMKDSEPYRTFDEAERPGAAPKYGIELLSGSQTSLPDSANAIERINREIARIMGTEQLLLGDGDRGSYALSKDKTGQFYLLVDSALTECREAVERDIIEQLWRINGWPEESRPTTRTEAVRVRDVEEITTGLANMAQAGAVLPPNDPVINQLRDEWGLEHTPEPEEIDAYLSRMAEDEDDAPVSGPPRPGGTRATR